MIDQYLQDISVQFTKKGDLLIIDGKRCFVEQDKETEVNITDGTLALNISERASKLALDEKIDCIIYKFGGHYYWTSIENIFDLKLEEIYSSNELVEMSYLGIHGRYEVMNGTRKYEDWCERSKQLGYSKLGICETHTLAGTLPFQLACKKYDIKSTLGMTLMIEGETRYEIKVFANNEQGWENLLKFNKQINVDETWITQDQIFQGRFNGVTAIIAPHQGFDIAKSEKFRVVFDQVFYQISTNEYYSTSKEIEVLENMKYWLENRQLHLSPILLSDTYVLDKKDCGIKLSLNKQGSSNHGYQTKNHYFRTELKLCEEFSELFNDDSWADVFIEASNNTAFEPYVIPTGTFKLPKYEMSNLEAEQFDTNEELFNHLIELKRGKVKHHDQQVIDDRLQVEIATIKEGGFIDYFLILWDILRWSHEQKITVGPGRGSAGGSLVAYLLGITSIDPIKFELLFERFLNSGRLGELVQKEFVKITINNIDIELDINEKIYIFAYGNRKQIYARDIKEGDEIDENEIARISKILYR